MECRNCKDECESWCEDCRDNCDLCTCFKNYNRNQPERSKREDSLLRELLESSSGKLDTSEHAEPPLVWDKDLNFIGHKVLEEMRCSELYGNIERDK
jgi:hypothetical protein